jgi:hypothetical protein
MKAFNHTKKLQKRRSKTHSQPAMASGLRHFRLTLNISSLVLFFSSRALVLWEQSFFHVACCRSLDSPILDGRMDLIRCDRLMPTFVPTPTGLAERKTAHVSDRTNDRNRRQTRGLK